tara:strand:+ start:89 stop:1390 length:1302 start_codon:yes stop_codon:yes gene_type:complete
MNNTSLIINSSKELIGDIMIPGDKSITHRAIILGSICSGKVTISNGLYSEDCLKTISCFKEMGVEIKTNDYRIEIIGKGLRSLRPPKETLDAGNSGTLSRLLSGILSCQNFDSTINGDESLNSRPMKRIIDPLTSVGAIIKSKDYKLPLSFKASNSLMPIIYKSHIPSAQIKSCLLLASLFIDGESVISEETKTRDHTERLLQYFDYPFEVSDKKIIIKGNGSLNARDIDIPSDISSAAFFIVAALITKGSDILLINIGTNPLRTGILDVLTDMGADIKFINNRVIGNEPVSDIRIKYSRLKSINVSSKIISRLIDELPILFIACATCDGTSTINDIKELRYKESDRILSMETGLKKLGIHVTSTENSISITGGSINGGIVDSFGDHRVAMSFLIAGLVSKKPITVTNTENINTSFPNFIDILREQNIDIYKI